MDMAWYGMVYGPIDIEAYPHSGRTSKFQMPDCLHNCVLNACVSLPVRVYVCCIYVTTQTTAM